MTSTASSLPVFELLFERRGLPRSGLSGQLAAAYGGDLGFEGPRLFANFVGSVDGVVALPGSAESGQVISRNSEADRFLMGLLRASADAVLIGAGTFRRAPEHVWHPGVIHPRAAPLFAEWRARLGLSPQPQLVIVSGSGALDLTRPALQDALIVTSVPGASKLRAILPPQARLLVLDFRELRMSQVVERLRAEGFARVLTEGGPSLLGRLAAEQLVDELFLTSSPALFGRFPNDQRGGLINGADLGGTPLELLSVRRHGSHLFLRYALSRTRP